MSVIVPLRYLIDVDKKTELIPFLVENEGVKQTV
jgi:hypothetical protein